MTSTGREFPQREFYHHRARPSRFAIADNGSSRAVCGSPARCASSLYKCQIPALVLGPPPARFIQSSICAVEFDLVVVLAFGKRRQLVQVFREPRRLLWQMHKTVLDHRGLGVHAHDLVRLRLVAGDRVQAVIDQFLDQLGARGFVLDQDDTGTERLALLAHRALQFGVFHALAQYVQ